MLPFFRFTKYPANYKIAFSKKSIDCFIQIIKKEVYVKEAANGHEYIR
jgi:hypothetical protein